jgi:DNA binding domain, excisionase family
MDSQIITTLSPDELAMLVAERVMAILSRQSSTPPQSTEYLSRQEVADRLKITLVTLAAWTKTGKITGHRIGRRVLYKAAEVEKALTEIVTK